MRYDLVVIGNEYEGADGAIAAAKLRRRVALIEIPRTGVSTSERNSLSRFSPHLLADVVRHWELERQRNRRGALGNLDPNDSLAELRKRARTLAEREWNQRRQQLETHGVAVFRGAASFVDQNQVAVTTDGETTALMGDRFLVACGSRTETSRQFAVDGRGIFTPEELWQVPLLRQKLIVVGGGIAGIEHGFLLARLGAQVTIVDGRSQLLDFCDRQIVEAVLFAGRSLGMDFQLGEEAIAANVLPEDRVAVQLLTGRRIVGDQLLYAAGRRGNAELLNLAAAGLEADERGFLWCDQEHRTWVEHIFGAGDVVGYPRLTRRTIDQERRAVYRAFDRCLGLAGSSCGCTIETVPQISCVGLSEQQLIAARIPFEVGVCDLVDRAELRPSRARFPQGLLKVLFHRTDRKLLGVHCVGESADEFVRCAETVIAAAGRVEELIEAAPFDGALTRSFEAAVRDGLVRLEMRIPAVAPR